MSVSTFTKIQRKVKEVAEFIETALKLVALWTFVQRLGWFKRKQGGHIVRRYPHQY